MDLTSRQQDIPVPINATFASGHMIHHHLHLQDPHRLHDPFLDKHEHDHPSPHNNHNDIHQSPPQQIPSSIIVPSPESLHDQDDDQAPRNSNGSNRKHRHDPHHEEVIVRYRECLKNHAASMGGNSTDGCGEFMPSGQEGTLEALTCSACNCHRNFHRKEVLQAAGTQPSPGGIIMPTPSSRVATSSCFDYHHHADPRGPHPHQMMMMVNNGRAIGGGRKLINMVYPATANATITTPPPPCRSVPPLMPTYCSSMGGAGGSDDLSDDQHGCGGGLMINRYRVGGGPPPPPLTGGGMSKKRFRTKFSQEQKERMLNFAEKVGWKIQKQEESVVQQFCQEIGVKRRVLKVWMHNNKHNLAKKTVSSSPTPPTTA